MQGGLYQLGRADYFTFSARRGSRFPYWRNASKAFISTGSFFQFYYRQSIKTMQHHARAIR
ncbi:hypothetical protein OH687_22790 [Burkholderia anthina]|nr:hypothetical protein OH687_22790 [Burkholderia anthina]